LTRPSLQLPELLTAFTAFPAELLEEHDQASRDADHPIDELDEVETQALID
jgi:hypothetical protein